jgi:hypothetical protein
MQNIVKIFQKFEMRYTQTCTYLKVIQCDTPKRVTVVCFHPKHNVLCDNRGDALVHLINNPFWLCLFFSMFFKLFQCCASIRFFDMPSKQFIKFFQLFAHWVNYIITIVFH